MPVNDSPIIEFESMFFSFGYPPILPIAFITR